MLLLLTHFSIADTLLSQKRVYLCTVPINLGGNNMDHRIKELIKEKGYTQQELAEKLGMSRVGLTQLVNSKPSYPTLEKIAEALGVEMWELFKSKSEIVEEIKEEKKNTVPCPYCGRDINVSLLKKEEE